MILLFLDLKCVMSFFLLLDFLARQSTGTSTTVRSNTNTPAEADAPMISGRLRPGGAVISSSVSCEVISKLVVSFGSSAIERQTIYILIVKEPLTSVAFLFPSLPDLCIGVGTYWEGEGALGDKYPPPPPPQYLTHKLHSLCLVK